MKIDSNSIVFASVVSANKDIMSLLSSDIPPSQLALICMRKEFSDIKVAFAKVVVEH